MTELKKFKLNFIRSEQHLMLPTVTSIKLAQNLYDVLFQYLITEEKEEQLKKLINLLEIHIKSKDRSPFSIAISELDFLDEGLQELRLLNWMEIPVAIFKLSLDASIAKDDYQEELEKILTYLEALMIYSKPADSDLIQVYPYVLVR
jgi:predicted transcriptional regulator